MLELAAQTYVAPQTALRFHLREPLRLPAQGCLFLRGENGVGKSTFLEHVFIPHMRTRHELLYLAQDMELQQNTMRATLALLGQTAAQELPDLAAAWIAASGCRELIILDEFDKYLSPAHKAALPLSEFTWVVIVSHLQQDTWPDFSHASELFFSRSSPLTTDIRVGVRRLWPV